MKKIVIKNNNGNLETTIDIDKKIKDNVKKEIIEEMIDQLQHLMTIGERADWFDENYKINVPNNFKIELNFALADKPDETNIMETRVFTGDQDLTLDDIKIIVTALEQLIE